MARITIEDCLKDGYNKFTLVHLASKRVIQFRKGKERLLETTNKEVVTALREIAAGKVRMRKIDNVLPEESEQGLEAIDTEQGSEAIDTEQEAETSSIDDPLTEEQNS